MTIAGDVLILAALAYVALRELQRWARGSNGSRPRPRGGGRR